MEQKRLVVSISFNPALNESHQINLPEEFLKELIDSEKEHPYIFEIKNHFHIFFSSVLEFSAEESTIELPYVLANQFGLENNDIIEIKYLSKVLFCKDLQLEPLTESFFNTENYEKFLESKLSRFSLLYLNQVFYLTDDQNNTYAIKVKKIEPDFENINFSDFTTENQKCYIITNQDVNVDIVNQFEIDRYYEEKRLRRHEMLLRASEHKKMAREDINVLKLGQKVGENNTRTRQSISLEDIRKARLARFSSKK